MPSTNRNILVTGLVLIVIMMGFTTDKPAYRLYHGKGKEVKFDKMIDQLAEADIVLFGEYHNNAMLHWLELQVGKSLSKVKKGQMVVGSEVFERDDQLLIDEYQSGLINLKSFKQEAKLWDNFATDYEPILLWTTSSQIPFVATNIPRRYASSISKKGFEALDSISDEAKSYIAPLPIEVDFEIPSYKRMLGMFGAHGMQGKEEQAKHFVRAQAIKDATMAHFILTNWTKGQLFYHINGSYHSDDHEGIVWYLKQARPDLKVMTLSATEVGEDWEIKEEEFGKADFLIAVPDDMIKSY